MKKNKIVGVLLLALAILTIMGMVINNDTYWLIYNFATIIFSVISGLVLIKQNS
ncbi:MAG: hypothetical protein PHR84_03065 [Candidatus Omnitrophica bacterium]|nr:hypothetical protein [Candidatus Omnitrophota bacterium]